MATACARPWRILSIVKKSWCRTFDERNGALGLRFCLGDMTEVGRGIERAWPERDSRAKGAVTTHRRSPRTNAEAPLGCLKARRRRYNAKLISQSRAPLRAGAAWRRSPVLSQTRSRAVVPPRHVEVFLIGNFGRQVRSTLVGHDGTGEQAEGDEECSQQSHLNLRRPVLGRHTHSCSESF